SCFSFLNHAARPFGGGFSAEVGTAMVLSASMAKIRVVFFTHQSIPLLPATVKRNLRSLAVNSGDSRTQDCSWKGALRHDVIGRDGKEEASGRRSDLVSQSWSM